MVYVDNAPDFVLGQDVFGNAVKVVMTVKSGSSEILPGAPLKISGANKQLEPAGANEKVFAILEDMGIDPNTNTRKTFPANTTKKASVILFGVVKVRFGGACSRGAPVKAGSDGKFVAAVNTVSIPSGATQVLSTSAQPSMTVEAGIACGIALDNIAADGDDGLILFGRC
ncbi:MAG: hypothetical protein QW698_07465 [Nitrososphaerales archaeon]